MSPRGGLIGTRPSDNRSENIPGVGQYNLGEMMQKDKPKMGIIGKDKRRSLDLNCYSPSPGAYE